MIGPSSRSAGHVVRGRADQLHAAVEGLVVGLGALEARQERVVDVDRPAGQRAAQRRRTAPACSAPARPGATPCSSTSSSSCASASALVSGVTGTWWNVDAVRRAPAASASGWFETTAGISICSDAGAGAEQQVVEAVQVLGDHDQRAVRRRRVPQLEAPSRTPRRPARSPRGARPRRSAPATAKSIRMKNRPRRAGRRTAGSPGCCRRARPGSRDTACTMPGRSGQERIRTKSPAAWSRSGAGGVIVGPPSVGIRRCVHETQSAIRNNFVR